MAGSGTAQLRDDPRVVLRVTNLVVEFGSGGERVHAVSDVSFDILEGETLGLVGESGCGKSTTGHAINRLVPSVSGTVELNGTDLTALDDEELRRLRPQFQMVFQDPLSSLNPRRKVRDIVAEPLRIWRRDQKAAWDEQVRDMLEAVGLDAEQVGNRHPREFSGGQSQRISIARALILDPKLLVCDEPVSSLDVSVQAQIINLFAAMRERFSLALLFIAHDLAVVKHVSDRLAVMYLGKLCEIGSADAIYERPAHPYTRALLESVPSLDRPIEAPHLQGEVPSAIRPPSGCRFRGRCPLATEVCAAEEPVMRPIGPDRFVACHHPLTAGEDGQVEPAPHPAPSTSLS
jgi:peptide/nickel transport system ATP-binding protein